MSPPPTGGRKNSIEASAALVKGKDVMTRSQGIRPSPGVVVVAQSIEVFGKEMKLDDGVWMAFIDR